MKVTKTMVDICNLRLTNGLSCRSCKFYGEACKGAEANIKQTGKATIHNTKSQTNGGN